MLKQAEPAQKAGRSKQRRKAVNLSIDAQLLESAKAAGINLSEAAEKGIRAANEKAAKEEHKAYFNYWNDHIEENGLPLERDVLF